MAEQLKKEGNDALQAGDFDLAITKYTEAIALDPANHILYSNRSAAYASSHQYEEAEVDGRKCVELKPDFVKGHGRVGAALVGLGRFDDGIAAYRLGLAVDANNQPIKDGIADAERLKAEAARRGARGGGNQSLGLDELGSLFGPSLLPKIAASPDHRHLLEDTEFMALLARIQANPSLVAENLKDSRLVDCLGLALGQKVRVQRQGDGDFHSGHAARGGAGTSDEGYRSSGSRPAEKSSAKPEAQLTEGQKKANEAKDRGNALYKKREFDAALAAYAEAAELDPDNIVYAVNRLSVLLEMGRFEDLEKEADEAIEKARQLRPLPFEMVGKCIARKGAGKERQGDLEGAIALYKQAMTEHRSADTLKKLQTAERTLTQKKAEEYLDPEIGRQKKDEGNAFFKDQKYPEAVAAYSEAIKRAPKEPSYYTNRAAAYMKLMALPEALKDCDAALDLDPKNTRAMCRKAKVYTLRKELTKALEWYDRALTLDPDSSEAKDGKADTYRLVMSSQKGAESEEDHKERLARAMADPEIQEILMDPMIKIVLNTLSTNPEKGQDYLRDKDIAAKLEKLIVAGVVSTKAH